MSCRGKFHMNWTVLRGHLFSKTEFSLAQRWPVNTGLTVILFCVWKCWLKYIIKMSFWQHFYNPIKLQKIAFNTYNYIFILLNTIEIIIMSPKRSLRDILCLLRFLLLFFFLSFFLPSAKSLSDTFLSNYWTEINETSQEC